jgi:hypothetical protein
MTGLLATLLVFGLGAAVVYLASEINHRRYRLIVADDHLVVERGRRLPLGFEPYEPDAEALKQAYSALPIAPGAKITSGEVYDDRTDLDRALFALLAGWARDGLQGDSEAMKRSLTYAERAALLPGLSEEQRKELTALRADLAYAHARQLMSQAVDQLEAAKSELDSAVKLGSRRAQDAAQWLSVLEGRLPAIRPLGDLRAALPPASPPPSNSNEEPPKTEQKSAPQGGREP